MNDDSFWDNFEEKIIETMSKETPFKESRIRLSLEQTKKSSLLGYAIKYARQKKRISAKKMAELLKINESDIKKIESGHVRDFPLGLIINYLNWLDCVLSFQIIDLSRTRSSKNGA
ncbi:multiprotein-bridging factor 1 family protein [Candidatus Omnitrophota bacterium]